MDSCGGKGRRGQGVEKRVGQEYQPEYFSGCLSSLVLGASHAGLYLYVEDVDALFRRALEAGAKEFQPVQDMFWGDRVGKFTDPSGYLWGVATHKEDVTPEQIEERLSALPQG